MRPVRQISDVEEGFRVVQKGIFHVPKRNPVKPEPEGTIVLAAFRITGYHSDCDGSLMASLEHIDQDGEITGWTSDGHGLYPDTELVVSPEEWKSMFTKGEQA